MIDPRDYRDVTGEYVGGDRKVHKTDAFKPSVRCSAVGDVFRSQFPRKTYQSEVVNDMINLVLVTLAE